MAQDTPFYCDFCGHQFTTSDTVYILNVTGKRVDVCKDCRKEINKQREKAHLPTL